MGLLQEWMRVQHEAKRKPPVLIDRFGSSMQLVGDPGVVIKWNPLPRRTRVHDWLCSVEGTWWDVNGSSRADSRLAFSDNDIILNPFPEWRVKWISAAEAKQRWSTPVGGNKRE
jgi:hypothetical protein